MGTGLAEKNVESCGAQNWEVNCRVYTLSCLQESHSYPDLTNPPTQQAPHLKVGKEGLYDHTP